jgi:hypothetical protein
MRKTKLATFLPLALLLAACGGGGGGDGGGSPPAPSPPSVPLVVAPTGLNYPTRLDMTINVAIAPVIPSVTGSPDSYEIYPSLPHGLSLNMSNGAITGTPDAITPPATYFITAKNPAGYSRSEVTIAVNDLLPVFHYETTRYSFSLGSPSVGIIPVTTGVDVGGAITSWSISPPLPAGLALHTDTGIIDGTPNVTSAPAVYRVTAHNSGGGTPFDLTLSVSSRVLIDLGHEGSIFDLKLSGQRMLSAASDGRVVLWNSQTGEKLYAEYLNCRSCPTQIAMAGPLAVVRHQTGITLLSSSDGTVRATIPLPSSASWWRLASDGSYVSYGNSSALTVWSATGTTLIHRTGNYASAIAFAAAGEVRIGAGPAGAQVIEKISVPSGTQATSAPFQGVMHSWFIDGDRFFANAANNVWIYTSDATQLQLISLPTIEGLAGRANRFWTATQTLSLYSVGGSATPELTSNIGLSYHIAVSANVLAVLPRFEERIRILDLESATPALTDVVTPLEATAFGAHSTTDWVFGSLTGVVMGEVPAVGTPQVYSHGYVRALVGNNHRVACATWSGFIHYYDGATLALQGEIPFAAAHLSLSDDGTLLLADTGDTAQTSLMRFYELPSETLLQERTYVGPPALVHASLSGSGTVVGELFDLGLSGTVGFKSTYQRSFTDLTGAPNFSDTVDGASSSVLLSSLLMSPDGVHQASVSGDVDPNAATSIRDGSTLVGAAPGVPMGWIDNSRLLVNRYQYERFGTIGYVRSEIVNLAGQVLSTVPLRYAGYFQSISGERIYSPSTNSVYSLVDGSVLWSSATASSEKGAVAGTNVVFASSAQVFVEPL